MSRGVERAARRSPRGGAVALLAVALAALPAAAQLPPPDARLDLGLPPILRAAAIEQRLDAQVPLGATFRDEQGETIVLGELLGERPTILILAYYTCPMLCSQVLNGAAKTLSVVELDLGRDYQVLTVSFDPRDTPEAAGAAKRGYTERTGKPGAAAGWHFLTGDEPQIRALADAVGFGYEFDATKNQYAHSSALILLTPEGRVSRYYFGIEYSARDVRLGLVEAAARRIGNPVDQLLLYCYQYDPATGKYGAVVMNLLRVAAVVTVIALVALIVLLRPAWRRSQQSAGQV
jgi:protein SCO1/2